MTVDKQRMAQGPPRARRVPWSPRAWNQALLVAGGIPVQVVPWLLLILLARVGLRSAGDWNASRWLAAILGTAVAALVLIPLLTRVQSHRLRSAGVNVPRQPQRPDWLSPGGVVAALRSQSAWRQVAYHLLAGPLIACAAIIAVGVWVTSAVFGLIYAYAWALPTASAFHRDAYGSTAPPFGPLLTLAGLAGLLAAPWLTSLVAALDARAGRALLGPSRAEELEHRVAQLTQTRAGVVDAADAERRRLERDLHDGTQQRLVSLAMNLGMARAQEGSAEQANQAIAEAHEEAKAALAELRDLIRGLHPAVLEDRGLDAALSGIIARTPIPCPADRGPAAAPGAGDRGGRLLRGIRGALQHRQARPGQRGRGVRPAVRRPAARDRHRRRGGRRRPLPRHRPGRPGQARRLRRRHLRNRQPARRANPPHGGPAMQQITASETVPGRPAAPRGRWIWYVSGVATILAGTLLIALATSKAGNPSGPAFQQTALPTRTVTLPGTVTSLNVSSYGAPIEVTSAAVSEVTVVETISFGGPGGPPIVRARVNHGTLTLAAPSCQNSGCQVGFAVTVPAGVTMSASSEGGTVSVSGAAAANIDSGGGDVDATGIGGGLTVTSENGGITVVGAGSASLDSGGGAVAVSGVHGPLTVTSENGEIDAHDIGSGVLDSGGGPVSANAVLGTLTVTSENGSINVDGAQGANLNSGGGEVVARSIDGPLSATTDNGSLQVGGLTGPLTADTGGGPLTASGITSVTARVSTDNGSAWLGFAKAPQSVQVTTGGGAAVLVLPGGPYTVSAESAGGPELVSVPVSPGASSIIAVSTGGGELQVEPPAAGS